jgi:hypothetical protein
MGSPSRPPSPISGSIHTISDKDAGHLHLIQRGCAMASKDSDEHCTAHSCGKVVVFEQEKECAREQRPRDSGSKKSRR